MANLYKQAIKRQVQKFQAAGQEEKFRTIGNVTTTGPPQPTTGRFLGPPAHRGPRPPKPTGGGYGGGHQGHSLGEKPGSTLRQLRRKAGITRAELRGNAKLNQAAGVLGVGKGQQNQGHVQGRRKLLVAYDKGSMRQLVRKLRKAKNNPSPDVFRHQGGRKPR